MLRTGHHVWIIFMFRAYVLCVIVLKEVVNIGWDREVAQDWGQGCQVRLIKINQLWIQKNVSR